MPILEDLLATTPNELLYTMFLPFIIVFAIFFGVLSSLRFFSKKINLVLSLALTVTAAYGGLFTWVATYLMPFGAYFGVAAFAIVFFVGIAIWGLGRGKDIYYESVGGEKKLEEINKKIEKLYEKYRNESNPEKKRALYNTIMELEREREHIRRDMASSRY